MDRSTKRRFFRFLLRRTSRDQHCDADSAILERWASEIDQIQLILSISVRKRAQ